jgi:hypothetical protein
MDDTRLVELAIAGLEAQRARIEEELAQLRGRVDGGSEEEEAPVSGKKKRGRRPMSPAAKKALSARMKKYWAARRKANR